MNYRDVLESEIVMSFPIWEKEMSIRLYPGDNDKISGSLKRDGSVDKEVSESLEGFTAKDK